MRHRPGYPLLVLTAIVLFSWSISIRAQGSAGLPGSSTGSITGTGGIRGRIVYQNGDQVNRAFRVTLSNVGRVRIDSIFTDAQGQFEFRNMRPGEYLVEIEGDGQRYENTTERVAVYRGTGSVVTIALKERASSRAAGDGVVSVGEIGADVPGKARKEFERAAKFAKDGKVVDAVDHLQKALEIYPNFLMALNDLGVQFLELENLDAAEAELRKAIAVDPKAFNPYLNLGIVLVKKRQFSEAADKLKTAISLASDSPAANLYLGIALMNLKDFQGAERQLKTAYDLGGNSYAVSFFYLGQVYVQTGDRERAKHAFESYLEHEPTAANAPEARKLIGMLQR